MNEWRIPPEDRAKHDSQFAMLNPANGLVSGNNARGFLLKSGLPPAVLGHIWELSDLDKDGQMNKLEFSIAMCLIKHKLLGNELPKSLPPSLTTEQAPPGRPAPPQTYGAAPGRPRPPTQAPAGFSNLPQQYGAAPVQAQQYGVAPVQAQAGFGAKDGFGTTPLVAPQTYGAAPGSVAYGVAPGQPVTGVPPSDPNAGAMPGATRDKYLTIYKSQGDPPVMPAKQAQLLLLQSGLPQVTLAQIWGLSDMDLDGALSRHEFCVAMYLCEQARAGRPMPSVLPPGLRAPPLTNGVAVPVVVPGGVPVLQLEEPEMSAAQKEALRASFEDKRQENFSRGQAELERRRKALEEAQAAEEEARQAAVRADDERRANIRAEQEAARLKEQERLKAIRDEEERVREAARQEALAQREEARREMERQRRLEWEKRRVVELEQENMREKELLEASHAEVANCRCQMEQLDSKTNDLKEKVTTFKEQMDALKAVLEKMKETRDEKMVTINDLRTKFTKKSAEANAVKVEKAQLKQRIAASQTAGENAQLTKVLDEAEAKRTVVATMKEEITQLSQPPETCEAPKREDLTRLTSSVSELEKHVGALREQCLSRRDQLRAQRDQQAASKLQATAATVKQPPRPVSQPLNQFNSGGDPFANAFGQPAADPWGASSAGAEADPFAQAPPPAAAAAVADPFQSAHGSDPFASAFETTPADAFSDGFSTTAVGTVMYACFDFQSSNEDEVDLHQNERVETITQEGVDPGWIMIRTSANQQGIVPASYLSETVPLVADELSSIDGEIVPPDTSVGEWCIAGFAYPAGQEGDLAFPEGARIRVLKKEGDWWTGEYEGLIGVFPATFVGPDVKLTGHPDVLSEAKPEPQPTADTPDPTGSSMSPQSNREDRPISRSSSQSGIKREVVTAIAHFRPKDGSDQLLLEPGQLITVKRKAKSGWWYGETHVKGKAKTAGWFPENYVKVFQGPNPGSRSQTPLPIDEERVETIYPYRQQNEDELTFDKGVVILVLEKPDEDWWKGSLNGQTGMFPRNYVKPKP